MTCLILLHDPKPSKMRVKEGPTSSALASGRVRVRLWPVNFWPRVSSLSPYQVSRSPPVTESASQGKVRMERQLREEVDAAIAAGVALRPADVQVVERAAELEIERR